MQLREGTTSACAENTRFYAAQTGCIRNYLRVRGEYPAQLCAIFRSTELPPRARRIPYAVPHATASHGTTSACAENTPGRTLRTGLTRNYLRVRGEYLASGLSISRIMELPPRARRIPRLRPKSFMFGGTTSACAENTAASPTIAGAQWNYLRVRGEYARALGEHLESLELPPRARRIPRPIQLFLPPRGTTSACAENTRFRLRG